MNENKFSSSKKILIIGFVFFHIFTILISLAPWQNKIIEAYRGYTLTQQYWSMFAPTPEYKTSWTSVRVVMDWKDGKPVYDPTPLYQNFSGTLAERTAKPWSNSAREFSLTNRLSRPGHKKTLEYFGTYWAREYRKKHPTGGEEIHVLRLSTPVLVNGEYQQIYPDMILWHGKI